MENKGKHCSIFINDTEVKYYPDAENITEFFGIENKDFVKYLTLMPMNGKTPCHLAIDLLSDRPDIALLLIASSIYEMIVK